MVSYRSVHPILEDVSEEVHRGKDEETLPDSEGVSEPLREVSNHGEANVVEKQDIEEPLGVTRTLLVIWILR